MFECGRRGWLLILALFAILAGCQSANVSLQASPAGESGGSAAGLSIDLVQWLFPVDAGDYESGAAIYEAPFVRGDDLRVALCLERAGYRDLAAAIRLDEPPSVGGSGLLMFPAPPEWELEDLATSSQMPAVAVMNNVYLGPDPSGEQKRQLVEFLATDLENNPRLGVQPSGAEELYNTLRTCMQVEPLSRPPALDQADLYYSDWGQVLADVDEQAEVVESLTIAAECLQEVGPDFADQDGPFEWLALWDALASTTPVGELDRWRQLRGWLGDYYDCMVPVIEIRRPLRLEARDRLVDENLTQLLELQSSLESALQDLND